TMKMRLDLREQEEALTEAERRLEFLDREIVALKNEMELRKQISNNTIVTAVSRQTQRDLRAIYILTHALA
ncbi:hypothetical protein ACLBO7_31105, partial [Klebsiella pneumoniae]